jgi:hypothetical protein
MVRTSNLSIIGTQAPSAQMADIWSISAVLICPDPVCREVVLSPPPPSTLNQQGKRLGPPDGLKTRVSRFSTICAKIQGLN